MVSLHCDADGCALVFLRDFSTFHLVALNAAAPQR
jgi:hypothetical protein